jgi:dTDP-4-dehydrorhamnose reductase
MTSRGLTLVIGADGTIGRALVDRLARAGRPVLGTTRRRDASGPDRLHLDLASDVSSWQPPAGVSAAFLCAAVTSLERCRSDPVGTERVNVEHTIVVARKLVEAGAFVVFLSTNLVFDGTVPARAAHDPVCPRTCYGAQKARAEAKLLALAERVAVVRLTKVVAPDLPLLGGWVRSLKSRHVIHPFSDLVMAPVPLAFVVEVLDRLALVRLGGLLQVSADRDVTYAEAAHHFARRLGADPELVQPVTSAEAGVRLEAVPAHTTLDTTRLCEELRLRPPTVWQALDSIFDPIRDAAESPRAA